MEKKEIYKKKKEKLETQNSANIQDTGDLETLSNLTGEKKKQSPESRHRQQPQEATGTSQEVFGCISLYGVTTNGAQQHIQQTNTYML